MIIDTTELEVQVIDSFSKWESLKKVFGLIGIFVPIFNLLLGITTGVLAIVWLEREISVAVQQRIGLEYASPLSCIGQGSKRLADWDFLGLSKMI